MAKTDIIIHDEKDNVAVVVIDKTSKNQECIGWIMENDKTIKIKLNKGDINSSNDDYLKLLNQKNLNSIYVSAIATHASYSFLDKINKNNEKDIVIKVNNFLSFIDSSLEFYEGFILEIQYLLSIIKQDNNNDSLIYDETQKLYQEIIDNDKVSALLKERVKTIHESQKYK